MISATSGSESRRLFSSIYLSISLLGKKMLRTSRRKETHVLVLGGERIVRVDWRHCGGTVQWVSQKD